MRSIRTALTAVTLLAGGALLAQAPPGDDAGAVTPTNTPLLFVANSASDSMQVMKESDNTLVPGTAAGPSPTFIAVNPSGTLALLTNIDNGEVTPVDLTTATPEAPIVTPGGAYGATGVAITPDGTTAVVANQDPPSSPTVSIINLGTDAVSNIAMPPDSFPNQVAISPDGGEAYVTLYGAGSLMPINLASDVLGTPIPLGSTISPQGVALSPDGDHAYVTSIGGGLVPVNLLTDTAGAVIPTGDGASGVAVSPDGSTAYVADFYANNVQVVNLTDDTDGPLGRRHGLRHGRF
jgi:DNA-binding beta-propeller fold protein YncE